MSEVKRYKVNELTGAAGDTIKHSPSVDVVYASSYDAAQSELSSLQAEVGRLQRAEKNDLIAYKAAIEKQDELREDLAKVSGERDRLRNGVESDMAEIDRIQSMYDGEFRKSSGLKQRLTAAEQRNAILAGVLPILKMVKGDGLHVFLNSSERAALEAALKPTESGASE